MRQDVVALAHNVPSAVPVHTRDATSAFERRLRVSRCSGSRKRCWVRPQARQELKATVEASQRLGIVDARATELDPSGIWVSWVMCAVPAALRDLEPLWQHSDHACTNLPYGAPGPGQNSRLHWAPTAAWQVLSCFSHVHLVCVV